jgi:NodT family efflux transporter outer membrane factor (OMF) lipoprotein
MVGPNYQRPEAAVNESWQAQTGAGEEESAANVSWWETFNDPTLTALVQAACGQNLSLRVAGLRVLEARAARGIAVGEFFPQTQEAFGGIDANQLSANDIVSGGDRSFATDAVGLQAIWELDFWGKFRRGIEAADAEVLLSVADYDTVLVSLAADVATAYIQIRSAEERLVVARQNVTLQAETLALTQTRFQAGAVSELDVATARATLANTKALVPELERSLRQAKLALCILLGRTPSELDEELAPAAGESRRVPEPPAHIATGVPADLLRRRPDVRAAERLAAAQSARIGQATANLYPSISIAGSTAFVSSTYQGARSPDLGNIFDADSFSGFIGLQLNWPLLNYGRIEGGIRVQDARYEQAVAAYQDSVLRAAGEVEAGLSDFLRSRERAMHLAEAVAASERSVELSLIQYRAGAVDFIRVNDAQTELVQQEDSLVASRADIALGAVRTFRALGGGWEVHRGQEFIDAATAQRMRARTDWADVLSPQWPEGKDLGFSRPSMSAETGGGNK